MPLILLRGSNVRARVKLATEADTAFKLFDCEVDGSLDLSNEELTSQCKGDFWDLIAAGLSSGTGNISLLASDTKVSTTNAIVNYLIDHQLKRTRLTLEFAETDDEGALPSDSTKQVYIRGDAFISDCTWNFPNQQFVDTSFTFTFGGSIEHS